MNIWTRIEFEVGRYIKNLQLRHRWQQTRLLIKAGRSPKEYNEDGIFLSRFIMTLELLVIIVSLLVASGPLFHISSWIISWAIVVSVALYLVMRSRK